jgi:hypothetical protein
MIGQDRTEIGKDLNFETFSAEIRKKTEISYKVGLIEVNRNLACVAT